MRWVWKGSKIKGGAQGREHRSLPALPRRVGGDYVLGLALAAAAR
jgi:hypothetical protein